jgi:hypothetical protein
MSVSPWSRFPGGSSPHQPPRASSSGRIRSSCAPSFVPLRPSHFYESLCRRYDTTTRSPMHQSGGESGSWSGDQGPERGDARGRSLSKSGTTLRGLVNPALGPDLALRPEQDWVYRALSLPRSYASRREGSTGKHWRLGDERSRRLSGDAGASSSDGTPRAVVCLSRDHAETGRPPPRNQASRRDRNHYPRPESERYPSSPDAIVIASPLA